MEPGLQETAFYAAPNLAPPDDEDRVSPSATHGFIADVAVVEIDRATGRVNVLDYATAHDAGRLLNPLIAEGQVRGDFAHGIGAALFERIVYDDDGNLLTGTFMDYLCPTAPDLPPLQIGAPGDAVAVHAARGEGDRRGEHDDRPGRDRERGRRRARDRARRGAAHAGPRLGAAAMKPVAFRYERPESVEEAVALLAEHGDEAKVLAGGQSLVPMLNMRLARPSVVVDVNRLPLGEVDARQRHVAGRARSSARPTAGCSRSRSWPSACRTSATSSRATAERSAGRSRTRTPPPSWRSP